MKTFKTEIKKLFAITMLDALCATQKTAYLVIFSMGYELKNHKIIIPNSGIFAVSC